MKRIGFVVMLSAAIALMLGCEAGKQRKQMLQDLEDVKSEQKAMHDNQDLMLKNQKTTIEGQEQLKSGVDLLLQHSQKSLGMEQNILSLVSDTNTKVTSGNQMMGKTLDAVYREIYGLGVDFRAAVGETRTVVQVNNRLPLKVHAEIPKADMEYEPVTKLPIGALIFQCQKVTDAWYKGVILREGEKETVYFAVKYTMPLRETLAPPEVLSMGETGMN